MRQGIYLDNNATTRVDPRVLEAMLPYFSDEYGNAASRQHAFGRMALDRVEEARSHIARLIGADARELIFTSGATESNNLAILGTAFAKKESGAHIITAAGEHPSVLDPCRHLEKHGFRLTVLSIDRHGRVDPDEVAGAMTDQT